MMPLRLLSSKAPAAFLKSLCSRATAAGLDVDPESAGGVVAEDRVKSGDACDIIVLAADAIARLAAVDRVVPDSRVTLFNATTVAAVRVGSATGGLGNEDALRELTEGARVGISTGPSGKAIRALLDERGIEASYVVAEPGVPVATLLRQRGCDVAFQQESELVGQPGIRVLGPLPESLSISTDFDGAVCSASPRRDDALEALAALHHLTTAEKKDNA